MDVGTQTHQPLWPHEFSFMALTPFKLCLFILKERFFLSLLLFVPHALFL